MVVRHEFGPEGAAYVRSYLEANGAFGKLLGPLLLAALQIDQGIVWASLPAELPGERTSPPTDFQTGGIYADREEASTARATDDAWLRETLDGQPDTWLLCVEDGLARPSDPYQARSEEPVFYCADSVYLFWTAASPDRPTSDVFGGATWNPSVAVITTMANGVASKDVVAELTIAEFAARASAVVIGAWDGEGLIFWAPRREPTARGA